MSCDVIDMTFMSIKLKNKIVKTLGNVRHMLDLHINLISPKTLDELGYLYKIEGEVLKIIKGALSVMSGVKVNGSYVQSGHTFIDKHVSYAFEYVAFTLHDSIVLWHNMLGHIREKGLHVLHKQGQFGKDIINKLYFCDHIVLCKIIFVIILCCANIINLILMLIHTNLIPFLSMHM